MKIDGIKTKTSDYWKYTLSIHSEYITKML